MAGDNNTGPRAISQGKKARDDQIVESAQVASPRYKFDPESRKFV